MLLIGTEADDKFVITANGIYGSGRFISYLEVEIVEVDGQAGDDSFFVLSTAPGVQVRLFGSLGSDTVNVAGDAPAVEADDLLGHNGLIEHFVTSVESFWNGIAVDGLAADIADDDEPAIVLSESLGNTIVYERGATSDSYTIKLTRAPSTDVVITVSGPAPTPYTELIRSFAVELSLDGITWAPSVDVVFTPADWSSPKIVHVRAIDDLSSEGSTTIALQHLVVGQVVASVGAATLNTLTSASFAGLTQLVGKTLVIQSGAGAGQGRTIVAVSGDTVTLDKPWVETPTAGDAFAIRGATTGGDDYHGIALPNVAVRVIDSDEAGVVIVPAGTLQAGEGGALATYEVTLQRAPLLDTVVRLTPTAGQLEIVGGGTLIFTAGGPLTQLVTVRAVDDALPESFHFAYVVHTLDNADALEGIATPRARADEIGVATSFLENQVAGFTVRIVEGTGAGQVRLIRSNAAGSVLVLQTDWDTRPDATSRYVISGYTAPVTTAEVTGRILSSNASTIDVGELLPTLRGGLSGATLRILDAAGAVIATRTIASNTASSITVDSPFGIALDPTQTYFVIDLVGLTIERAPVLVSDNDAPGVRIEQSDGSTRLVEGGDTDSYTVVLTRRPTENVYVTIAPVNTPTLDGATFRSVTQVTVSAPGATINPDGSITLEFTPDTWDAPQTVTVTAIQDDFVDGGDLQAFADSAQRVHQIQGPLYVFGGDNPNASEADYSLPPATMLPGESSGPLRTPAATSLKAIESHQVDTLNVFNADSIAEAFGTLTSTRLTGLGMADDQFIAGRSVQGGVTYDDFEALNVHLGHGIDHFLIESTHDGTTRVTAGDGNDVVDVRTITGPTFIEGGAGDDTVTVTQAGTVDLIAALLTIDGGFGDDTVNVDDSAEVSNDLGWLTQTSLTGLGMTGRAGLDALYSLTRPATGGFTITILGVGSVHFDGTESAADIARELQDLLFPLTDDDPRESARCGLEGTTRCSQSVFAYEYFNSAANHGRDVLIGFRGERNAGVGPVPQIHVTGDDNDAAVAVERLRVDGINYYGLETLNLRLGHGHDVLNVRGTIPTTNLDLGDGDDRVYVSHLADVAIDGRPDYLPGHLDLIEGELNIAMGAGRHTLMISDEMASIGDGAVLITDQTPRNEILVRGLAPAEITYGAAPAGSFYDGITIWSGSGADTITIDGTHTRNQGLWTITALNTGLGDDRVTVDLDLFEDGFFVLHTQGAYDNRLHLATDLRLGDLPLPADAVRVFVGGVLVDPSRYVVDYATNTIGLFDSYVLDQPVRVEFTRFFLVSATGDGTATQFGVAGDRVTAYVNGVAATGTFDGATFTFDNAPAAGSYVTFHLEIDGAQEFTIPQVSDSDADTVRAQASTLPLIVFGGQDDDDIYAGANEDIVFGDRGRVFYGITTLATDLANLTATELAAPMVLGNAGPGDIYSAIVRETSLVTTVDLSIGGDDTLDGQGDDDVLLGGAVDDTIDGGTGQDLIFGDQALLQRRPGVITNARFQQLIAGRLYSRSDLDFSNPAIAGDNSGALLIDGVARDFLLRLGIVVPDWAEYDVRQLWHSSTIEAGQHVVARAASFGGDYIAGGPGDDVIFGQLGVDTILGDGDIESARAGAFRTPGDVSDPLGPLTLVGTFEAATDGDDYIEAGGGGDIVFGGLGQDDIIGGSSSLFSLVTRDLRPDGADWLFGGAGTRTDRRATDPATVNHGRDADAIAGDNANIHRIVNNGSFAGFAYDNAYGEQLVVRGVVLLDYTPGGPDFRPDLFGAAPVGCGADIGGADEVHGESGDDWIYGACGNDRLFGDDEDDDVIGGWGHDWISGGTGQDGVLGDDGRIFTSRNGTAEALYGVVATTQSTISASGNSQTAVINVTGQLNKAADLTPFNLRPNAAGADDPHFDPAFADDVIFGGLGDDFLHGGAGDDAMSGAEALGEAYAGRYVGGTLVGVVRSDFSRPFNAGDILHYVEVFRGDVRIGAHEYYDRFDPRRGILLLDNGRLSKTGAGKHFLLNWNAADGRVETSPGNGTVRSDGNDVMFGDLGNDWLAGGTGRDTLWGGWGNDELDVDDDKFREPGGVNNTTDNHPSYVDRAYGGAGLDVLIGNSMDDRLIDWVGEFNSYIVPFNPFGQSAVSRTNAPSLREFLYALSRAQGADPTRAAETTADPARNGEPEGEIGLVTQEDDAYGDQNGAPRDPQGPIGGTAAVAAAGVAPQDSGAAAGSVDLRTDLGRGRGLVRGLQYSDGMIAATPAPAASVLPTRQAAPLLPRNLRRNGVARA